MKKYKLFQVDAFTDVLFGGNPAAVCVMDNLLPSEKLQKIAAENFLPETAFFAPGSTDADFQLKWFTPEIEMDLCGHATLASAHVLFSHLGYKNNSIRFQTLSGELNVSRDADMISLDFPSRMPVASKLPDEIVKAFHKTPKEVYKSRDYVLVFESEDDIVSLTPNRALLDQINLDPGGIIVTAKGKNVDFVSRFFTPQASIFEDPVTGSAHCSLIPLWSRKLNKKKMTALQLSERKGKLNCEDRTDRVSIAGKAVTYLEGEIYL